MNVKLDDYEVRVLINGLIQQHRSYDAETNGQIDSLALFGNKEVILYFLQKPMMEIGFLFLWLSPNLQLKKRNITFQNEQFKE